MPQTSTDARFDAWLETLQGEVVQGEYGYEEGEFTVYPDHWRPLFDEGLTPQQAFRRALDARAEQGREEDRLRRENYARIQADDAALVSGPRR